MYNPFKGRPSIGQEMTFPLKGGSDIEDAKKRLDYQKRQLERLGRVVLEPASDLQISTADRRWHVYTQPWRVAALDPSWFEPNYAI